MISVIFDCVENVEHFTTLLGQLNYDLSDFESIDVLIPYRDDSLLESIEKSVDRFSSRMYWRIFKLKEDQRSIRPLFDDATYKKKRLFIRHDCLFTPGSIRHIATIAETHILQPTVWQITNRFKNADRFSGFVPDVYYADYLSQEPLDDGVDYCFVVPNGIDLSDDHHNSGGYVFASKRKIENDLFLSDSRLEEVNNAMQYSLGAL